MTAQHVRVFVQRAILAKQHHIGYTAAANQSKMFLHRFHPRRFKLDHLLFSDVDREIHMQITVVLFETANTTFLYDTTKVDVMCDV